jgi:hypothetical protein
MATSRPKKVFRAARSVRQNPARPCPWRDVVMKYLDGKDHLSLGLVYQRMGWTERTVYQRRKFPDMRIQEAGRLALACEAPIAEFLRDLVLQLGLTPVGQQALSARAKAAYRGRYFRKCLVCLSHEHKTGKCPRLISPEAALEILKADHLLDRGRRNVSARRTRAAINANR